MKKVISDSSYSLLVASTRVVPRDEANNLVSFKVGKEYTVISKSNDKEIKVRCTQDCPYHLKMIVPDDSMQARLDRAGVETIRPENGMAEDVILRYKGKSIKRGYVSNVEYLCKKFFDLDI